MTATIHLFWQQSVFNQWTRSPFVYDNVEYINCEQFMMAQKASIFGDDEIYEKIMRETNPKTIKGLGRRVKGFDTTIWDQHKYQIVVLGNMAKFTDPRNSDMKEALLSTGNSMLAEASPYDKIWGIGVAADHTDATNPSKWRGENLLGKALMEVRDALKG